MRLLHRIYYFRLKPFDILSRVVEQVRIRDLINSGQQSSATYTVSKWHDNDYPERVLMARLIIFILIACFLAQFSFQVHAQTPPAQQVFRIDDRLYRPGMLDIPRSRPELPSLSQNCDWTEMLYKERLKLLEAKVSELERQLNIRNANK